jgi:ATP-dependent RNA helicase DeaD
VEALVETINAHGQRAEALHGGMLQRQRDKVMGLFRAKKADMLVATDVAARGLDIEHISHVVNYDVPASPEVYLHRIGRTGRAGRGGTAITLAEPRERRLLRVIEQFTKSKIDVGTVPSVADLRVRQLDVTRAALRERLLAADFDQVRVVVESLAEEFDIVNIACAAVHMAHTASAGDGNDREIPVIDMAARPEGTREARGSFEKAPAAKREAGRGPRDAVAAAGRLVDKPKRHVESDGRIIRLFVGAGRLAGVRPGDLVGAITGEAGIDSRSLGAIEIGDRFSLVEVPESMADEIIEAMRSASIRGKKVQFRRERTS